MWYYLMLEMRLPNQTNWLYMTELLAISKMLCQLINSIPFYGLSSIVESTYFVDKGYSLRSSLM